MQAKRILVGVTGGIAAYKTADLVRRLIGKQPDPTPGGSQRYSSKNSDTNRHRSDSSAPARRPARPARSTPRTSRRDPDQPHLRR